MRRDLNRACSVLGGKHSHLQGGPDGLSPHILSCCLFTEAPGEGTAQVSRQVEIWNLSSTGATSHQEACCCPELKDTPIMFQVLPSGGVLAALQKASPLPLLIPTGQCPITFYHLCRASESCQ